MTATEQLVADAAVIAEFVAHMQVRKLSEVTIRDRIYDLGRLRRFLDGTPLLAATPARLAQWQASIRHLSANSLRVYTTHVQQFYRWALDAELLETDPSRRLVRPRVPRGAPHPIAEADLTVLFAIATDPLRLVFALAVFAGLRCAEISRLRDTDLDLQAAVPVARIHGKGGAVRRVPLLAPLVTELARRSGRRGGPLVLTPTGVPFTAAHLSKTANAWLHDVLGTDSTLHSLRHHYATNAYRLTRDILLVQRLLGHSDVSTTQIYVEPAAADDALDRLRGMRDRAAELLGGDEDQAVSYSGNVVQFPTRPTG